MRTIGNTIKARRRLLRITQQQLADIAGVSINTLTKIERNEGNPTLDVLERVLDALGLDLTACIRTVA
jgi:y4mF family transcriptional regulator